MIKDFKVYVTGNIELFIEGTLPVLGELKESLKISDEQSSSKYSRTLWHKRIMGGLDALLAF